MYIRIIAGSSVITYQTPAQALAALIEGDLLAQGVAVAAIEERAISFTPEIADVFDAANPEAEAPAAKSPPSDGEILDAIRAGHVTAPRIAEHTGAESEAVSRILSRLSRAGKVENLGTRGPGAKWTIVEAPASEAAA